MAVYNSAGARIYPGRPKDAPPDMEERAMDFARRTLDDIPSCRDADYDVRWVGGLPMLVMEFGQAAASIRGGSAVPALGISLVKVNGGTLLEAYPGNELFRGEKLRVHILKSVIDYLDKVGVGLGLG